MRHDCHMRHECQQCQQCQQIREINFMISQTNLLTLLTLLTLGLFWCVSKLTIENIDVKSNADTADTCSFRARSRRRARA